MLRKKKGEPLGFLIFISILIFLMLATAFYGLVFRPQVKIRKSGLTMSLATFYMLQAEPIPVIRLLEYAKLFRDRGIILNWDDLSLFYNSARIELASNPSKYKTDLPEELLKDILQTIDLIKDQGYDIGFQTVAMRVLSGQNPRQITSDFLAPLWKTKV